MSIRRRLIVTSLVTLAVGLGALVVIGNVLLAVRTQADTTTLLEGRADAQIAALEATSSGVTEHETPNDETLDRQSWVLDGDAVKERPSGVSEELDRAAISLGRTRRPLERGGPNDFRLLTRPVFASGRADAVGSVVVGASTEPFDRLRDEVLVGSLVLSLLVLFAGWIAIRGAVDGALGPVAKMTEDAESWGAHDLDRRFGMGPPTDELSSLAATLDRLLARIAASRRHEQHFASEVAHELRTPIAALKARAELALQATGRGAVTERAQALRAVADATERLDATISTLLAVARREIDPTLGSVDLRTLAHEIENVEVVAPAELPDAEGDAEIIRRAIAPLIANARRHTRSEIRLVLSQRDDQVRLEIHDDGDGVEETLGQRVFEPGVRGPGASEDGAGLGLALSRRLARACGGDVSLEDDCFVLELPAV